MVSSQEASDTTLSPLRVVTLKCSWLAPSDNFTMLTRSGPSRIT